MVIYLLIMYACAVLFLVLGISIYRGNTKLIHDYHQIYIGEDRKPEYGRAFSKGLFVLSAALFFSGTLDMVLKDGIWLSMIVLIVGILISVTVFVRVQRRFNVKK